jgi:hypothetical protein
MRRLARRWLPVVVAPFLASCVFLLDYDELQKDDPSQSTGGQGTSGAAAASAGGEAGGASTSCADCDDQDACTIDTCDETGDAPVCLHEPTVGLKLDGFDVALPSEHHARVSVVASGKLFYFAALQTDNNTPQISLYRLASDGTELEPLGTDTKLEGVPVSNVGLAVEELALGEVALHGFVAAKPKLGDLAAKVFHLVNRDATTATNLVGTAYQEGNETVFPQALNIGGKIVGAWILPGGTVAVHEVGSARTDTFGAATVPATTLSLLSTADDKPAVMFTAQATPGSAIGTYVETAGQNRARFAECETRAGDYRSSSVIATQIPGVWLANVTRYGADYLTSGGGGLACANGSCTPLPEDCAKATPSNALRNVAGATLHFPTDDAGIVYSVLAVPQITTRDDDPMTAEARLSLQLGRVDFSTPGKPESTSIGGDVDTHLLKIAHNDTSEAAGFAGPDWPAVGILPTEQVAVAWIQPSATAAGTDLHVQRYKMCLPVP